MLLWQHCIFVIVVETCGLNKETASNVLKTWSCTEAFEMVTSFNLSVIYIKSRWWFLPPHASKAFKVRSYALIIGHWGRWAPGSGRPRSLPLLHRLHKYQITWRRHKWVSLAGDTHEWMMLNAEGRWRCSGWRHAKCWCHRRAQMAAESTDSERKFR